MASPPPAASRQVTATLPGASSPTPSYAAPTVSVITSPTPIVSVPAESLTHPCGAFTPQPPPYHLQASVTSPSQRTLVTATSATALPAPSTYVSGSTMAAGTTMGAPASAGTTVSGVGSTALAAPSSVVYASNLASPPPPTASNLASPPPPTASAFDHTAGAVHYRVHRQTISSTPGVPAPEFAASATATPVSTAPGIATPVAMAGGAAAPVAAPPPSYMPGPCTTQVTGALSPVPCTTMRLRSTAGSVPFPPEAHMLMSPEIQQLHDLLAEERHQRQHLEALVQALKARIDKLDPPDTPLRAAVRKVEARQNVRVNHETGHVTLLRPIDFVPKNTKHEPIAEFRNPRHADEICKDVAEIAKLFDCPMTVEGHTKGGESEFWMALAQDRARAVAEKLVEYGADPEKLNAIGLPGKLGKNEVRTVIYMDIANIDEERVPVLTGEENDMIDASAAAADGQQQLMVAPVEPLQVSMAMGGGMPRLTNGHVVERAVSQTMMMGSSHSSPLLGNRPSVHVAMRVTPPNYKQAPGR